VTKWHGGKGSNPRPIKNQKEFEENWDKIFGRKKIPKHGATKIHVDKTKLKPRDYKYNNIEE
tara:strand:+ start:16443 stop:16628 length:186 start_codon:yes stop_codon:yes gene_type:complete